MRTRIAFWRAQFIAHLEHFVAQLGRRGFELKSLARLCGDDDGVGVILAEQQADSEHVRAKLRTDPGQLITRIVDAVSYAKQAGRQVVFTAEDDAWLRGGL